MSAPRIVDSTPRLVDPAANRAGPRRLSRAVRSCIRRRALELSQEAYRAFVSDLERFVQAGAIDPAELELAVKSWSKECPRA